MASGRRSLGDPAHRALAEPELFDVLGGADQGRTQACMRSVRVSSSASQNATNGALDDLLGGLGDRGQDRGGSSDEVTR